MKFWVAAVKPLIAVRRRLQRRDADVSPLRNRYARSKTEGDVVKKIQSALNRLHRNLVEAHMYNE